MAAPQQSGQPDNSMGVLWIIAGLFVGGGVIWYAFKVQIINFYFKIKLFEISIISYFTNNLEDVKTTILTTSPGKFTFDDVVKVGQVVGEYLRIPFVLIIFVLAFVVYFTNSTRVFKRTYSMRDLVNLEKENWPQITPVAGLDLVKENIDKGPWAMAMTPMQFCKKHNLLEEHKRQMQEGMTRKEWDRIDVTLKRGLSNKVFALQLGPLWQGTKRLPPYIRALFAVFAARYNGDSKVAHELLAQMAATSVTQMNFAGADELCKKHEGTKNVQKLLQSHAYVLTVMATMLESAREDGVQASADFLWLKPLDRRLWYMLNTVGRQTPFVEVAGPFAHWLAEKEIGKRLLTPMVEEATNALEIALKEIVYRPDEPDEK
jgi:intracellular multiplication protein IcmP